MTQIKTQRLSCFNTRFKKVLNRGYCGPCRWKWKCGNKRGETQIGKMGVQWKLVDIKTGKILASLKPFDLGDLLKTEWERQYYGSPSKRSKERI